MKKILAIFLVACFILCFSACGNKENSSDLSNDNFQTSSTETQTNTSDESSGSDETNEPNSLDGSSNADNANDSNSSNGSGDLSNNNSSSGKNNSNPTNSSSNSNNTNGSNSSDTSNSSNSTNGTNNSTIPTHTHKFSNATCTTPAKCSCGATKGSALGHKWQDATCKAPKTCSVCKKAEGNKAEHIVEGTTCKWCKQVVVVNPNKLDANIEYTHLGPMFYREFEWDNRPLKKYDCYVLIQLRLKDFTCGDEVFLETNTPLFGDDYYHNGKYYAQLVQWCECFDTSYKIEGSEIVVTLTTYDCEDKQVFTFELLSDNTLRVKSISGAEFIYLSYNSGLKVGSIFYPNPHHRFD